MASWVEQIHRRAQILVDQIIAARAAAESTDVKLDWLEGQYRALLEQLYANEYAAAHLRDASDLVMRAEGPGATHDGPLLRSFSWLSEHVRTQLKRLSEAVLPLSGADAKAISKKLGWVFTGYAPGSIMMGFALRNPKAVPGFEVADAEAFQLVRSAAQSIAAVPQYVGDAQLDIGLTEKLTDPALRDAAIVAAWHLSPTPQSGIYTVEVASSAGDHGVLSQRERMVLKESIASPLFRMTQNGAFEGSLRAADLDTCRIVLRDVNGIGAIRCAISPQLTREAQAFFGSRVRVSGTYETDPQGRPRMMRIDRITKVTEPTTEQMF